MFKIVRPTAQPTQFTKQDLCLQHYRWNADRGDNPLQTGRPDNYLVDRDEGYEVLSLLTQFARSKAIPDAAFRWAETELQRIPGNIRGRDQLLAELQSRWPIVLRPTPNTVAR